MKSLLKMLQNSLVLTSWGIGLVFSALAVSAESQPLNGAEIFNNNCARCHNTRSLDEFSLEEWSVIMPHMREKAHLTGKETEAVMQFVALVKNGVGDSKESQQTQSEPSGEALFSKYSCQGCHSVKGKGGTVGPALDSTITNKGKAFFVQKLKNPQFNNPASPMPKMPLTDTEIDALSDYLQTLSINKTLKY